MLRWAEEQSLARKVARQTLSPTVQEKSKSEVESFGNDEKKLTASYKILEDRLSSNVDNVEVTPVPSWCDFDQLFPTDTGINDVTPVPSWCDFEEDQPTAISLQQIIGECFVETPKDLEEDKQPRLEVMAGELRYESIKTPCVVDKEIGLIKDSSMTSQAVFQEMLADEEAREDDDLDKLMSLLKDIPELEPDYVWQPAVTSTTTASVSSEINLSALNNSSQSTGHKLTNIALFETPSTIAKEDAKKEGHANHLQKSPVYDTCTCREPVELIDRVEDQAESVPVTGQTSAISVNKEPLSNTTKPVLRDLHKLKEIQSTVKESLKEVIAGIIKEKPLHDITTLPTAFESTKATPTQILKPTDESKVSVYTQMTNSSARPLVGSNKPHVYENKIKRRQHGLSSTTQHMTAGEILEFEKRRDEALEAVELKKQRTKMLLNQQFEKSSQTNSHIYKVKNTPKFKSLNKTATLPTRPSSNNRNEQTSQSSPACSSMASRKRRSSSINTSSAPKRARSSRPRIILRIFQDEDDWNVEQVIDRY